MGEERVICNKDDDSNVSHVAALLAEAARSKSHALETYAEFHQMYLISRYCFFPADLTDLCT